MKGNKNFNDISWHEPENEDKKTTNLDIKW